MHFIDTLGAKLVALANTKGTKDKAAIVATLDPQERDIIKRSLDPTTNFYVTPKTIPVMTLQGTAEWGDEEIKLLDDLSTRRVTGREALRLIGFHLRELKPTHADVLRRVLLKDMKVGVGVTMMNKAFPGLIPDFPYMRCSLPKDSKMHEWDWSEGHFSQTKADGSFANVVCHPYGEVEIITRQGTPYPKGALPLVEDVPDKARGHVIHGELLVYRSGKMLERKEGNGILNSLLQNGDLEPGCTVHLEAWDMIPAHMWRSKGKCPMPYRHRFAQLSETGLRLVDTKIVFSKEEAMAHYKEHLARGLEGTVVKHRDMIWFDGDSKEQVKLKLQVDVDLKIVGFVEGTPGAKTEKDFGSILCRTSDDLLEVAVAGIKDEVRAKIHRDREAYIGKVMAVRANSIIRPEGEASIFSLFSPRFLEVRLDKVEADSLQRVQDQFEAAVRA